MQLKCGHFWLLSNKIPAVPFSALDFCPEVNELSVRLQATLLRDTQRLCRVIQVFRFDPEDGSIASFAAGYGLHSGDINPGLL